MHVGYSIFDLNIKGPGRGHIIRVTQLQMLVKPNYASGPTLPKSQVCATPCSARGVRVWGSLRPRLCSHLWLPIGQMWLLGARETELGWQDRGFVVFCLHQQARWFFPPACTPMPPPVSSVEGSVCCVWYRASTRGQVPSRCLSAHSLSDLCGNERLPANTELINTVISLWEQGGAARSQDSSGDQQPAVSAAKTSH